MYLGVDTLGKKKGKNFKTVTTFLNEFNYSNNMQSQCNCTEI